MIYHAKKEWDWMESHPAVEAVVRAAFEEGRVDRFQFAGGAQAILGDIARTLNEDELFHAERIFFIEGTRRLRLGLVEALAPHGLHVRGDVHWKTVTSQYDDPIEYSNGLASFYRNCVVNLNTTSVQMTNAVNQRVFDCPAAGGFILTDKQSQLKELFDGEDEVVTYETLDEARDKLLWFLEHPKGRQEVVARAQKRIFGEHTYTHRLKKITEHLKGLYGG